MEQYTQVLDKSLGCYISNSLGCYFIISVQLGIPIPSDKKYILLPAIRGLETTHLQTLRVRTCYLAYFFASLEILESGDLKIHSRYYSKVISLLKTITGKENDVQL